MSDKIKIEILPGGIIKTTTDKVSGANHMNAEAFLREMGRLAGGKIERKHRHGTHGTHTHTHNHEGDHEHH